MGVGLAETFVDTDDAADVEETSATFCCRACCACPGLVVELDSGVRGVDFKDAVVFALLLAVFERPSSSSATKS